MNEEKDNGFYKRIKDKKEKSENNAFPVDFEMVAFESLILKLNIIKENMYYRKAWKLLKKDEISDESIDNFKKMFNENSFKFNLNYRHKIVDDFIDAANKYGYLLMEKVYNDVLEIKKEDTVRYDVFELFDWFQINIRKLIIDEIVKFELVLKGCLLGILKMENITLIESNGEKYLNIKPRKLKINIEQEFRKKMNSSIYNIENLDYLFEEFEFNDYIELIKKMKSKYTYLFKWLMYFLYSNQIINNKVKKEDFDKEINIELINFLFNEHKNTEKEKKINLNINDEESVDIFRNEFVNSLTIIKNLRNVIFHNKNIVFINWNESENFDLKKAIEAIYKLSFIRSTKLPSNLKQSIMNIAFSLKEQLIAMYPNKIKEISNYFKKFIFN